MPPHNTIGSRSGAPTTFSITQGFPINSNAARVASTYSGWVLPWMRCASVHA